jgi:hypothetical protein
MSFVRYATSQGIIESSPGYVKILPRRTSRRGNKDPLYLHGTTLHDLWKLRHLIQPFVMDLDPVVYERFVLETLSTSQGSTGTPQQHFCLQHLPQRQIALGYAENPGKAGWGYRNRIRMGVGNFLSSLYPAIGHASLTDGRPPEEPGHRWIIKGSDALEREFRISERQLMLNLDNEGSTALLLDRSRDALWRDVAGLALDVLEQGVGSYHQGIKVFEGHEVSAAKMQENLVRLEYEDADGHPVTLQLDESLIEVLAVLPQHYWGEGDYGSSLQYLFDDEDEFDDD